MVRRHIKVALSLLYFTLFVLPVWLASRLRGQSAGRTVVLCYHGVRPDQRAGFAKQMEQLLEAGSPVPLADDEALDGTWRSVAVTFDDAFSNLIENAIPELEKCVIPATIFVPSAHLGKTPAWWMDDGPSDGRERVMSADEVEAIARKGLIRVGSHTVSHRVLTRLDGTQLDEELRTSRRCLEGITGQPVELLALPYGAYEERVLTHARQAGYAQAFSIEPAVSRTGRSRFLVGRICVDPDDWPVEFWLKIRGAYEWIAVLHRLGLWGRSGRSPVGYR